MFSFNFKFHDGNLWWNMHLMSQDSCHHIVSYVTKYISRGGIYSSIYWWLDTSCYHVTGCPIYHLYYLCDDDCVIFSLKQILGPKWVIIRADQFYKSQNAPVPYPTMLHSEQKCEHFCSEWSIVGYETGAFWDLWIRSINKCFLYWVGKIGVKHWIMTVSALKGTAFYWFNLDR